MTAVFRVSSSAPRLRTQYVCAIYVGPFLYARRPLALVPLWSSRRQLSDRHPQERQGGYSLIELAFDPTQRVGPHNVWSAARLQGETWPRRQVCGNVIVNKGEDGVKDKIILPVA